MSSYNLSNPTTFKDFIKTFDLGAKLGLHSDWSDSITQENMPKVLREFGFALRRKTAIRVGVFDGQHRCHVIGNLLSGINDLTSDMVLSIDTPLDTRVTGDRTWDTLSILTDTVTVIMGAPATKVDGEETASVPGLKDIQCLRQYGYNTNASQSRDLGLSKYKDLLEHACEYIQNNHQTELHLTDEDLLREPVEGFVTIEKYLDALGDNIRECWKSRRSEEYFLQEYNKGSSTMPSDVLASLNMYLLPGKGSIFPKNKKVIPPLEGLFWLIQLASQNNDHTLEILPTIFSLSNFIKPQRPLLNPNTLKTTDVKQMPWIHEVITRTLQKIST